jgi:hypothetical protein
MSTTEALAPCIICNQPVSIDCHCRICNGWLHCFCAVPEGLEGHGCIYLCSADCRGSRRTPPTTPKRITVHVGGVQWSTPTTTTSPDQGSWHSPPTTRNCSPPTIQNTTTSPNRLSPPTTQNHDPPTIQNTTTSPNRHSPCTTQHVIQELPSLPPLLDERGNANFLHHSEESNNSGGDTGSDGEEPTVVDNSIVETAKFLLSHHPLKKFE